MLPGYAVMYPIELPTNAFPSLETATAKNPKPDFLASFGSRLIHGVFFSSRLKLAILNSPREDSTGARHVSATRGTVELVFIGELNHGAGLAIGFG